MFEEKERYSISSLFDTKRNHYKTYQMLTISNPCRKREYYARKNENNLVLDEENARIMYLMWLSYNVVRFDIPVKDSLSLKVRHGGAEVVGGRQSIIHQGPSLAPTDIGNFTKECVQSALLFSPHLHAISQRTAQTIQDQKVEVSFGLVLSKRISSRDSTELDYVRMLESCRSIPKKADRGQ